MAPPKKTKRSTSSSKATVSSSSKRSRHTGPSDTQNDNSGIMDSTPPPFNNSSDENENEEEDESQYSQDLLTGTSTEAGYTSPVTRPSEGLARTQPIQDNASRPGDSHTSQALVSDDAVVTRYSYAVIKAHVTQFGKPATLDGIARYAHHLENRVSNLSDKVKVLETQLSELRNDKNENADMKKVELMVQKSACIVFKQFKYPGTDVSQLFIEFAIIFY